MGTFYALGAVKELNANTKKALSKDEWKMLLHERFDTELFDFTVNNCEMTATLKADIFKENIRDFFGKLKVITGDESIAYKFEEFGDEIEEYTTGRCNFYVVDGEKNRVKLSVFYALLFIEGKVLVEQFSTEPVLINWLFRHVDFGNKLAGAIVSDIFG